MLVYHGTSKENIEDMQESGIDYPSYWTNNWELANEYANSHGDGKGVVLSVDTDDYDFKANILVAQCLYDDCEIDEMPDPNDLENSLENLEGIVCHDRIFSFDIAEKPGKKPKP